MTASDSPVVSVTIVAYNSAECIGNALSSICDEVALGFAEVIVVDNASPDDSSDIAASSCPRALVIRSEINRYYAGGCNLAWPHARGRYWLLLNPDVVVPPDGLRTLVAWMDEHPAIGAASPELVDACGTRQGATARRFQTISKSLMELSRAHLLLPPHRRADALLGAYWPGGEHLDVDWVPGAAMIVRREAVERAGLMSEDVPMYAEDTEWCWRLKRAGFRIGLAGSIRFRHDGEQSTARTWSQDERSYRLWLGSYGALRATRGRLYTMVTWALNIFVFATERINPRRSATDRRTARDILQMHLHLASSIVRAL